MLFSLCVVANNYSLFTVLTFFLIYVVLFFCYVHRASFLLDLKPGQLHKEAKNGSGIDQVGYYGSCSYITQFRSFDQTASKGKITSDIISTLSSHKMYQFIWNNQQLGWT